MEVVRNSINIAGLVATADLPVRASGQIIQFNDTDMIIMSDHQAKISSIFQVIVKASIHEVRTIKTPIGKTVILDGKKLLKIIYMQNNELGVAHFLEKELPINTFVELKEDSRIRSMNIYILDAYFELIDNKKIYSNILYYLEVVTEALPMRNIEKRSLFLQDHPNKYAEDNITVMPAKVNLPSNEVNDLNIDLEAEYF